MYRYDGDDDYDDLENGDDVEIHLGFSGYFYTLHFDHECIISQQFVTFDEQSFKGEVVGQSGQETLQWGLWQCFAYYRLLSSVKPCKWSTNSTCSHHHQPQGYLITR